MKLYSFQGDLTDVSSIKKPLLSSYTCTGFRMKSNTVSGDLINTSATTKSVVETRHLQQCDHNRIAFGVECVLARGVGYLGHCFTHDSV